MTTNSTLGELKTTKIECECDCYDTSLDTLCRDTVCVFDFSGNFEYVGFWADWCPHTKIVYFGGGWQKVPDLVIDHYPSEAEIADYAFEHVSLDKLKKINWIDEEEE